MTLPLVLVAVAGLLVVLGAVSVLIAWHPTRDHADPEPAGVDPATVSDWCEHENPDGSFAHCPATPTHELVGDITSHEQGSSAMVSAFCEEHAPEGAVRVRVIA